MRIWLVAIVLVILFSSLGFAETYYRGLNQISCEHEILVDPREACGIHSLEYEGKYYKFAKQIQLPAKPYILTYRGSAPKAGSNWPWTYRYDDNWERDLNVYFAGSAEDFPLTYFTKIPDSCAGKWDFLEDAEEKYYTCGPNKGPMTVNVEVDNQDDGMGTLYIWYQDDTCYDNFGLIWFCINPYVYPVTPCIECQSLTETHYCTSSDWMGAHVGESFKIQDKCYTVGASDINCVGDSIEPPVTTAFYASGCGECCPGSTPVCGDGEKQSNEECDDGNIINGDGCSSECKIEVEYSVELIADPDTLIARGFTAEEITGYNKKDEDNRAHVAPYDTLLFEFEVSGVDSVEDTLSGLKINGIVHNVEFSADLDGNPIEVGSTLEETEVSDQGNGVYKVKYKISSTGTIKDGWTSGSIFTAKLTGSVITREASAYIIENNRNTAIYSKAFDPNPVADKAVFSVIGSFNNIKDGENLDAIPDMMSLVPLAVWNNANNDVACLSGADDEFTNKCIYPLLFFDPSYSIALENLEFFSDRFQPFVTFDYTSGIIKKNFQKVDEQGAPVFNADNTVVMDSITFPVSEIPERFWKDLSIIVFAPKNDYKSLLTAAQLASYYNAPLITNDAAGKWKSVFDNGKLSVIVIDLDTTDIANADLEYIVKKNTIMELQKASDDENAELFLGYGKNINQVRITFFDINHVQKFFTDKYSDGIGTHDKFILVNPKDIHENRGDLTYDSQNNKEVVREYTNYIEDFSEPINAVVGGVTHSAKGYYRDSMAAPYLASVRDEVILFTETDALSWGLDGEPPVAGKNMFIQRTYDFRGRPTSAGKAYFIIDYPGNDFQQGLGVFTFNNGEIEHEKTIKYYVLPSGWRIRFQSIWEEHIAYDNGFFFIYDNERATLDKVSVDGKFIGSMDLTTDLTGKNVAAVVVDSNPSGNNNYVSLVLIPVPGQELPDNKKEVFFEIIRVKEDLSGKFSYAQTSEIPNNVIVKEVSGAFDQMGKVFFTVLTEDANHRKYTTLYIYDKDCSGLKKIKPFLISLEIDGSNPQPTLEGKYRFVISLENKLVMFKDLTHINFFKIEYPPDYTGTIHEFFCTPGEKKYVPDFELSSVVDWGNRWLKYYANSYDITKPEKHIYILDDELKLKEVSLWYNVDDDIAGSVNSFESPPKVFLKDCSQRVASTFNSRYSEMETKITERIEVVKTNLQAKSHLATDKSYLTVLASPRAVPLSYITDCDKDSSEDRDGADFQYATSLSTEARVGRIFTSSLYYTTMYITKEIFRNKLEGMDPVQGDSMHYQSLSEVSWDFPGLQMDSISMSRQIKDMGETIYCGIDNYQHIEGDTCDVPVGGFIVPFYENIRKDTKIFFIEGHGMSEKAGFLKTENIISVNPLDVISKSCGSGDYYSSIDNNLFSTTWLSNGASAFYGSLGGLRAIVSLFESNRIEILENPSQKILLRYLTKSNTETVSDALSDMREKTEEYMENSYNNINPHMSAWLDTFILFGDPLSKPSLQLGQELKTVSPNSVMKYTLEGEIGVYDLILKGSGFFTHELISYRNNGAISDFKIKLSGKQRNEDGTVTDINSIDTPNQFKWVVFNPDSLRITEIYEGPVLRPVFISLNGGDNIIAGRMYNSDGTFRQINFVIDVIDYEPGKLKHGQGDCDGDDECSKGLFCKDAPGIPPFEGDDLCCFQTEKVVADVCMRPTYDSDGGFEW